MYREANNGGVELSLGLGNHVTVFGWEKLLPRSSAFMEIPLALDVENGGWFHVYGNSGRLFPRRRIHLASQ